MRRGYGDFQKSESELDLIILDLNLPKKNGFVVCQEIRETSIIPIIILSARDNEDDKVRALELGADDYISKPFSPRELLARIGAIFEALWKTNNYGQKRDSNVFW